jgi:3-isopropylmalate/(R)-2-methylmalate dehydratase small subunit
VEPFSRLTAVAAPIDWANVDTDRIIPARFLRKPQGPELAAYLFHDVRFDAQGAPRPEFVLNQPAYRDARILVAAPNFACGSSREAAVWTLMAAGIRAVIAPSFGDIFASNAVKNGLLPVVLPPPVVAGILERLHAAPGSRMAVDLHAQTVGGADGATHGFSIDPFPRYCLLNGLDELGYTLGFAAQIADFERRYERERPYTAEPAPSCGQ